MLVDFPNYSRANPWQIKTIQTSAPMDVHITNKLQEGDYFALHISWEDILLKGCDTSEKADTIITKFDEFLKKQYVKSKIIWINSHNHISSLLLIYGILFCIFLHLKPNYNKNLFRNNMYIKAEKLIINVNYLFLVFLVLYYSTSFFLYPKNFFKKYSFLNYTSSNNFTYLSDLNREVIEEFSSIYRDDYFLLSESDSLISIITESKPTGLLYDFSTNSNHIFNSKSYPEFLDYLNSNFSKFIIDKSYIDRDKIYYKFLHDDVFNYLSFKKENTDNLIRELNIHRCETTRFFYIYCK